MDNLFKPFGPTAAKSGKHSGSQWKEESYKKAKEHFERSDQTAEEREAFVDYLMADERHWDGVERLFNETVQEESEPSMEADISFFHFLRRNGGFRQGWLKTELERMLAEDSEGEDFIWNDAECGKELPFSVRESLSLYGSLKRDRKFREEWITEQFEKMTAT